MSSSALIRVLRRPPYRSTIRYAGNMQFGLVMEIRHSLLRSFSVFNEFSKNLKGEASSNPEFQKSIKELNEKLGVVKEDFKVRTKRTAEKLYKSVDNVWTEAEARSKQVSVNVKEKLSAAKEEVSANVKEKMSAATEEVKETFGLGSKPCSESSNTTTENATSHTSQTSTEESLLGKFKSAFSSATPKISSTFQTLKLEKVSDIAKTGYNIVKDELTSDTVRTRRRIQYDASHKPSEVRSTRTDIVLTPSKKSRLSEKWEAFKKKMEGIPLYNRVKGASEPVVATVVNKGQEIAEDMRERWETSDHPVVHKIQDLNETVFGETATGLSFKEIRRRDPYFSLPDFVAEVQEMVRPVLTAYLKSDIETLKKYCCPEVVERCKGERQAYESQNMFFDSKILHISEIDVRETKMMGSTPIIIIGFQTQQIYCVRDRDGSIKDGGKDTIHTIYYAWAMQQMDMKELGEEEALFPVWKLREMQQIGVQSLI